MVKLMKLQAREADRLRRRDPPGRRKSALLEPTPLEVEKTSASGPIAIALDDADHGPSVRPFDLMDHISAARVLGVFDLSEHLAMVFLVALNVVLA